MKPVSPPISKRFIDYSEDLENIQEKLEKDIQELIDELEERIDSDDIYKLNRRYIKHYNELIRLYKLLANDKIVKDDKKRLEQYDKVYNKIMEKVIKTEQTQLDTFLKPLVERDISDNEYAGHTHFMLVFITYLLNKYKNSCKIDDLYGRGIIAPDYIANGINYCRRADKDGNITWNPEFVKQLGEALIKCVNLGNDVVLIPLIICLFQPGFHFNLLVYRPKLGVIDHFEPNGYTDYLPEYYHNVYKNMEILTEQLEPYIGKVKYNSPKNICPIGFLKSPRKPLIYLGPQQIEYTHRETRVKVKTEGFCVAWGLLLMELLLKFPTVPLDVILQDVYTYLGFENFEESKKKFTDLILNYSTDIYKIYKEYANKPQKRLHNVYLK